MTRKQKRLSVVMFGLALLGIAVALVLSAFEENLVFFFSPTDLKEQQVAPDRRLRVGGLVEEDSISKDQGGTTVTFRITDGAAVVPVSFTGILPDLFREGQGVVVEGKYDGKKFTATEVLAKHDENYMPPEVAEALKKSGHWQEEEQKQ